MTNQLEQLKQVTSVVADTGDIDAIAKYAPEDATTNPSLLLKAIQQPQYAHLAEQAVAWAKENCTPGKELEGAADKLSVIIGTEILKHVPGKVSTEVDARLSFDTEATIEKAHHLIALYKDAGVDVSRILIKVASTWEGIQAARELQKEGINCNLTLLFSFAQAQACAEAGVFLISPFVGRILDWYKGQNPDADYAGEKDPGVQSVARIYNFYKACGFNTIVMGASFRNIGEIQALAGCDKLTIGPALLDQLGEQAGELPRKLTPEVASQERPEALTEKAFRWEMNQDAMATEKLAEGIRKFAEDQETLDAILKKYF
jgi:transaldolase